MYLNKLYFYFSTLHIASLESLRPPLCICCAGTNTAHEVSVDLPIVQQQSEIEDHQGSHADHKVRMLLHPLLLTTNLSVVGSPFQYSRSTMLLLVVGAGAGAGALPCFNLTRTKQGLISACDGGKMHV